MTSTSNTWSLTGSQTRRVSCKAITETAGTISEPTVDPADPPHPDFGKHTVTGEKKYLLEKTYWNLYGEGKCLHTTLKWFRRKYKHVCIQSTQITMVGLTMAHGVLYAVQPNIHSLSVITSRQTIFKTEKTQTKCNRRMHELPSILPPKSQASRGREEAWKSVCLTFWKCISKTHKATGHGSYSVSLLLLEIWSPYFEGPYVPPVFTKKLKFARLTD